jgi:recombination protein RecT
MTDTTSNTNGNSRAITQFDRLKKMAANPEVVGRFEMILGNGAGSYIASVINTVYITSALQECTADSVMSAAIRAATFRFPIDPNIGFAYLIPYKYDGVKVARFQLGYKGYIQLALRTGQYLDINATEVYEGETVRVNRLTGHVEIGGEALSTNVIGYVAYFKLLNGMEKFYYMTAAQVAEHAAKYSKSYHDPKGAWATHPDDMGKKTVLSGLLRKWGPLTADLQAMIQEDIIDGQARDTEPFTPGDDGQGMPEGQGAPEQA